MLVNAAPERAFPVFTAGTGRWWPRSHHIGVADPETFVIEPRAGGRWYERGVDGAECEIDKVLVWEPPARLVLAWQLTTERTDGISIADLTLAPQVEPLARPNAGEAAVGSRFEDEPGDFAELPLDTTAGRGTPCAP
jgi:uncharacterized protein YndB with AHSA1/START domain